MQLKTLFLGLTMVIAGSAYAGLNDAREQVVTQYLTDLAKADYVDIANLFEENGIVMSTSRGAVNAREFFYAFLPNVQSAATEQHQLFTGKTDTNRLAARFHLAYQLKDGEQGEGEYMDEFVFSANSAKLAAVYMFENIKFKLSLAP
jgi:hypothetical protein